VFVPDKVSLSTFYRYLAQQDLAVSSAADAGEKEIKCFAYQ
jgi:hypothetical protein